MCFDMSQVFISSLWKRDFDNLFAMIFEKTR